MRRCAGLCFFCDVNICLSKVETRLTGLACNTGCKHNDIRTGGIAVVAGVYRAGRAKGYSLTDIERLAECLFRG